MRKFLIATHGTFASGISTSLDIIIGKNDNIRCIDAYVDEREFKKEIVQFFESLDEDDESVVFTDLFGGSVNQVIMNYLKEHNFFLITGMNLPVMLEILTIDESEELTKDELRKIVCAGQKQLQFVNDMISEEYVDDFE